ncbi:hypothetical protein [Luteococcus sp.]|uniref:hypothetical protein n=1 Tax=Luteococcus sp. TaxID=1969402 RepID=UPI003734CCED
MNRLIAASAAATLTLLALSGCATTSTPASSPPTASTTGTTQPSTSPTGAGSATSSAVDRANDDVVASRSATSAGNQFTLKLQPLQRSGSTVVLSAELIVDKAGGDVTSSRDLLSDPNDSISQAKGSMNGIGLIDPAGQKLFMPATTDQASSSAVCSPSFPTSIAAGDTITVSCTYAEIPTNLTSLNVQAPHFGTITNVPVR